MCDNDVMYGTSDLTSILSAWNQVIKLFLCKYCNTYAAIKKNNHGLIYFYTHNVMIVNTLRSKIVNYVLHFIKFN